MDKKKKKVRYQATLFEIIISVVWYGLWIGGGIFLFNPQGVWSMIGFVFVAFVLASVIGFVFLFFVRTMCDAINDAKV